MGPGDVAELKHPAFSSQNILGIVFRHIRNFFEYIKIVQSCYYWFKIDVLGTTRVFWDTRNLSFYHFKMSNWFFGCNLTLVWVRMYRGIGVFLYGSRLAVFPPIRIKSFFRRSAWNRSRSSWVESGVEEPDIEVDPSLPTIRLAVTITGFMEYRLSSVSALI